MRRGRQAKKAVTKRVFRGKGEGGGGGKKNAGGKVEAAKGSTPPGTSTPKIKKPFGAKEGDTKGGDAEKNVKKPT